MKKTWNVALLLALGLLVTVLAVACQQAEAPVQELKAGIGTPLSGTSAATGILVARTFEMVADDIGVFEVAGKKYKWKTIPEDNLYSSAGGVQTANKFINQDGVKFLYEFGSSAGASVQPIAEAAKVIFDASNSDRAFLGPKFKYTFRTYQSPADTYPALIGYLKQNQPQLKNWYILVSDDATGVAFEGASKPVLGHYGLNLVGNTRYVRETSDFYPVLVKVLPAKPDVIITLAADAVAMLVKQAREQGYTGKFLTANWPPKVPEIAGPKNAEGVMAAGADMWSEQTPKAMVDFAKRYKDKYGEEWPSTGLLAFPTPYLITEAMKQAGTVDDTDKIAKIMETQKLNTPLGPLFYGGVPAYGIAHQLVLPVWISEFKDGKLRTMATIPPDQAAKAIEEVYK